MEWINIKWARQIDEERTSSALLNFVIELSRDQAVSLIRL